MTSHAVAELRILRRVAGDPRVDAGADASCRSAEALVAAGAAPLQLSDAQVTCSQTAHTITGSTAHNSPSAERRQA